MTASSTGSYSKARSTVTVVVSHFAPAYGMERVTIKLLDLLRRDFTVKAVCVGGDEQDVAHVPDSVLLGKPLRGVKRLWSVWRLWKYARTDTSEHIILAGLWVALPWLLVCGKKSARSIVWEHSLLKSKFRTSRKLRLLAYLAKYLYPKARRIVAVSEPVQRDLADIAPRAAVVTIYNPLDMTPYGQGNCEHPRGPGTRLVTIGSLTLLKSQRLIIKALPHLDRGITLSVIGSGPEGATLQKLADDLGVSTRVCFEGFLSQAEVQQHLQRSDILVHCSIAETFGLVYMEAAQAGLPVISTRTDVAELLIPKYAPGLVCDPTPEALAAAVIRTISYPRCPQEYADAAERREVAFSPWAVQKRWFDLIQLDLPDGKILPPS